MKFNSKSIDIDHIKQVFKKVFNPVVAKNLCICLGLSLSILASSTIGMPGVSEMFTDEAYAATQFSDDASIRAYSREAVESLVKTGGIKGYPDGTFKPAGTITRIEYLSMAMNAVDPSGQARAKVIADMKSHSDGPEWGSYYDEAKNNMLDDIQEVWGGKAQDMLIVSSKIGAGMYDAPGDEVNGRSGWLQPITRAEAASTLVACLEKLGGEQLVIKDNIESIIGDWDKNLSPDSKKDHYNTVKGTLQKKSIQKLYSAGIVEGNEQRAYQPQYNLTREQAAQTIYRAVNKNKRANVVIAPKPVEAKPVIQNTTLNANDANRRTAIAGDTFVAKDGTQVKVTAGIDGIVGADLHVALDEGRYMSKSKKTVKNNSVCDGSLGDSIPYGANYIIAPNGCGLWDFQWKQLINHYLGQLPAGKEGDVVQSGPDNMFTYKYVGGAWGYKTPDWF